ncbi:MAG: hypothetical protein ISP46_04590 [Alphaproteobacteria bacterium]|nr:hypothetical protein [Alphaproteobacteria bacterium]
MSNLDIHDIVNLEQYPIIDNQSAAYKELVAKMANQYATESSCLLPNFILPKAVEAMASEASDVSKDSFRCDNLHNSYLEHDNTDFPKDHPRRRLERTALNVVGCDQLYPNGELVTL